MKSYTQLVLKTPTWTYTENCPAYVAVDHGVQLFGVMILTGHMLLNFKSNSLINSSGLIKKLVSDVVSEYKDAAVNGSKYSPTEWSITIRNNPEPVEVA